MKFIDKMKGKIGLSGDHDEEEDIREDELDEEKPARPTVTPSIPPPLPDNVISFSDLASGNSAKDLARRLNVIVITPVSFDDAQEIANNIKAKKPVVVNIEATDGEVAKRIIDFISGTTYALGGEIKRVGRNVFLCAPSNVSISDPDSGAGGNDFGWKS